MGENYHIRKQKLSTLEVPTITDIKSQLGENLAKIFIEQCPCSLRKEMSLEPKLSGPGDDLWISPSDILINKVVLKPPLTNKHIKALTHQGILEIGNKIEAKFQNEMELEKRKALHDQEELLNFCATRNLNYAVAQSKIIQEEQFEELVRNMNESFEERLQKSLKDLTNNLEQDYNRIYEEATEVLLAAKEEEWQLKLENAVKESVAKLTQHFLNDMQLQETQLTQKYNLQLESQKTKYETNIKEEQTICKMTLKQLKHNLQCNNIANLMYVLCVERRKCFDEHISIINNYKERLQEVQDQLSSRNVMVNKLVAEKNNKERQSNLREECLLQVIRQFQKFINFALRATPTQAEFLLNVDKMMMFELSEAILKTDKHHREHLTKALMPWKSDSKLDSSAYSAGTDPDYHNCLNELPRPKCSKTGSNDDEPLPAVYYNEHLYVREDFRNMFSQNLTVSSTSVLWNKDVEHLMHILRKSVSLNKTGTCSLDIEISRQRSHQSSRRSSVHFDSKNALNEDICSNISEKEKLEHLDSVSVALLATADSLIINKPSIKSKDSAERLIDTSSAKGTGGLSILAAPDSLTIIKPLHESRRNSKSADTFFLGSKKSKSSKLNFTDSRICNLIKAKQDIEQVEGTNVLTTHPSIKKYQTVNPKIPNIPEQISDTSSILPSSQRVSTTGELVNLVGSPRKLNSKVDNKRVSKLSLATDSLIKLHMTFSKANAKLLENSTNNTIDTSDSKCKKPFTGMKFHQHEETVEDSQENKFKHLSHCVLKLPEIKKHDFSSVNFCKIATVYAEPALEDTDTPWKIYENLSKGTIKSEPKTPPQKKVLNAPNTVKIVGNAMGKEHDQTTNEFTTHRIHSLLDILKKDKSLIRIFTSCAQ